MTYKVLFSPHAVGEYKKLDPQVKKQIQEAIDSIARHPLSGPKIKRLKGRLRNYSRYRSGDYRILFTVDVKSHTVFVDISNTEETFTDSRPL